MTTEEKIREAFDKSGLDYEYEYPFKLGYLALLNSLQSITPELYRLPEGVTREG